MHGEDPLEEGSWAVLCTGFHEVRLDAARHVLDDRWRDLVVATRRGAARLADWRRFVADLDRLAAGEEDFAGRGWRLLLGEEEIPFEDWWPQPAEHEDLYRCPGALCDRRAAAELGGPPACDLLGKCMTDEVP